MHALIHVHCVIINLHPLYLDSVCAIVTSSGFGPI